MTAKNVSKCEQIKQWTSQKLADVVEDDSPIVYGILQPGPEQSVGVPYLRPSEIKNDQIQLAEVRRTTPEIADQYERSQLRTGDIVMSIVGTIGKVVRIPAELDGGNITQSSARIRANENIILSEFLAWQLRAPFVTKQFEDAELGSTVPRLNLGDVRKLEVLVPTLDTQRRIVATLDTLTSHAQHANDYLTAIPPLIDKFRQSVLARAFTGELTADWRKNHPDVEPASQLLERIKTERRQKWIENYARKLADRTRARNLKKGKPFTDDDWQAYYDKKLIAAAKKYEEPEPVDAEKEGLPEIPDTWEWVRLEELTTEVTKGSSPAWQGFEYQDNGVPFVRSQNVLWGKLDLNSVAHLCPSFNEHQSRSVLCNKDVLLNIVGASIGRAAVVDKRIEGANINQAVALIRPLEMIYAYYLMNFIISPLSQRQISLQVVDVARANLNLTQVGAIQVPVPPISEQRELVRVINEHFILASNLTSTVRDIQGEQRRLKSSMLSAILNPETTKGPSEP